MHKTEVLIHIVWTTVNFLFPFPQILTDLIFYFIFSSFLPPPQHIFCLIHSIHPQLQLGFDK